MDSLNSINGMDSLMDGVNKYTFGAPSLHVTETSSSPVFEDFFDAAVSVLNDTNDAQKAAEQAMLDYMTGESDDILALTSAQGRADRTLNFTVQITNKIMAAYKEIINTQI